MEPIGILQPAEGYLDAVRQLADSHDAILIFDECWTGFRIDLKGAYGKYGVTPDLACFGKALGNGIPISVVLGHSDIMSVFDEIFFSFTFGGDMLGIVAALAVLDTLSKEPVVEHIEDIGTTLLNGVQELISTHDLSNNVTVNGYPGRHVIDFYVDGIIDLRAKSFFQQEAIKKGILSTAWHAPSYSHTREDVLITLDIYDGVFKELKKALETDSLTSLLEGKKVQPVFRKP
jgi:glutamate-1-semialdehyde aminotransferase